MMAATPGRHDAGRIRAGTAGRGHRPAQRAGAEADAAGRPRGAPFPFPFDPHRSRTGSAATHHIVPPGREPPR